MGNKFCVGSPSPKMDWRQLPIASGFWWVLIFLFCHCLQSFFSDKCCVLANSNSKMQVALNLGLLLILGETNHVVLYCCLLAKSKVNRGQHFSSQLLVFSIACVPQKMSLTSFNLSPQQPSVNLRHEVLLNPSGRIFKWHHQLQGEGQWEISVPYFTM